MMATKIYDIGHIDLIDGTSVILTPLKIKYLREFMVAFEDVKAAKTEEETISALTVCAAICMQQYYPRLSTVEELEDNVDLKTVYKILDIAAGIKINDESEEPVKEQATESGSSWEKLDLAGLEAELFLLGIWKDYEELESNLSMPELIATLDSKREAEYNEKKFLAAIQGVDLDKESKKTNEWEDLKAKVFSKGKARDGNDILALQGINAAQAGFGIGMGLDYVDMTKKPNKTKENSA